MKRSIVGLLLAVSAAMTAFAWDEVTHAYMAQMAIDQVTDAELRELLSANDDLVRFGSWFPDWGQYGDHPFDNGSHREVLAAYFAYVSRPEVRAQENWPELIAHFMGAYAHIVEDFFLDSTVYTYMRELDNGLSNDMGNGIMNIRLHGYLGIKVDAAYPYDDLERVYESIGYFDRDALDPADFRARIDKHTKVQFLQMRGLKLLSFLASDYIQSLMPWGAAHMYDAPGGVVDCTFATARVWDALWDELHGRPAPLFVHSLPADGGEIPSPDNESMYGRVTLVAAHAIDPQKLTSESMRLTNDRGRVIAGEVTLYPYHRDSDRYADLAVQFVPEEALEPGRAYRLDVAPGDYGVFQTARTDAYTLNFTGAGLPDTSASARRFGFRTGVFLLLILAGIGGVVFGLPGVLALRRSLRGGEMPRSVVMLVVRRATEALGVVVAGVGVAMLVTRAKAFIELLLDVF